MSDPTGASRIPELSTIEIRSTSALRKYVDESRRLARDFARELEFGAEEIQAVLVATGKGNPWLVGLDVKIRAKRIAKRCARAAELQRGSAAEMTRLWTDFMVQFAPALGTSPEKAKKQFKFDE
ncbi:hypothetical protein AB0O28_39080 [Microbispora sp. NPDC088329]|uniref:hypothetical protein n=1 Tax=Microbispora sp. NPDC088329 TaxID=3154869 RepID=UPI003446FCCF